MFTTKSNPTTTINGKIKDGIEIKIHVLYIGKRLKYEAGRWYSLGDNNKWYFLGFGSNPNFETTAENIINMELFDNVFEEVEL